MTDTSARTGPPREDVKTPKSTHFKGISRLLALMRNTWRTLTSMGTALVLLFLLALAAIPGALLPQRSLNEAKVAEYIALPGTIPHNVMVDGDRLLVAHYTEGVHLLDVRNPERPALITTFPGDTTMATLEDVRAFARGGSARIQR